MALGAAVAGLFVWAACGDDDSGAPAFVIEPDAGNDQAAPLRDATVVVDDNDAADDDVKQPVKVRGPYDAGPEDIQTLDGGDGGIPCVANGELEIEENDTQATANPLNPPSSRCGIARMRDPLDAGPDADASDAAPVAESDFMTFLISKEASNIYVQYHGDGVQVLVTAGDGGMVDISQPGAVLPFKRNVPYYVEVKSKTGKPELWRVSMFEDK